jgi:hypothetical protein
MLRRRRGSRSEVRRRESEGQRVTWIGCFKTNVGGGGNEGKEKSGIFKTYNIGKENMDR